MKTYFTLNDKRYEAKDFDFNLVCDMQEMGVDMLDMGNLRKNLFPALRVYVALCMEVDKDIAGSEIQAHVIKGGGFDEIMEAMQKKMEDSDFFRALNTTEEEETPKTPTKKSSKTTEK